MGPMNSYIVVATAEFEAPLEVHEGTVAGVTASFGVFAAEMEEAIPVAASELAALLAERGIISNAELVEVEAQKVSADEVEEELADAMKSCPEGERVFFRSGLAFFEEG